MAENVEPETLECLVTYPLFDLSHSVQENLYNFFDWDSFTWSTLVALSAFFLSILVFWKSFSHTKHSNRTSTFLELRNGYRDFYKRLHEQIPGLYYEDEVNLPHSWRKFTDEQKALAKEYWIQTFNEWFTSTELAGKYSSFLWRKFYSPVVASALRHYVLRRGLEEAGCSLYSFGTYEHRFFRAIYQCVEDDIGKLSGLWSPGLKNHYARWRWRIKNRNLGVFGSGDKIDLAWFKELKNDYFSKRGNLKDNVTDKNLVHIEYLLIMLGKLVERRKKIRTESALKSIEMEGSEILSNLGKPFNENIVNTIHKEELLKLGVSIFPKKATADGRCQWQR